MNEKFIYTYIGLCCREWVLHIGEHPGRCGLCGERPTYLRADPDSPRPMPEPIREWSWNG